MSNSNQVKQRTPRHDSGCVNEVLCTLGVCIIIIMLFPPPPFENENRKFSFFKSSPYLSSNQRAFLNNRFREWISEVKNTRQYYYVRSFPYNLRPNNRGYKLPYIERVLRVRLSAGDITSFCGTVP